MVRVHPKEASTTVSTTKLPVIVFNRVITIQEADHATAATSTNVRRQAQYIADWIKKIIILLVIACIVAVVSIYFTVVAYTTKGELLSNITSPAVGFDLNSCNSIQAAIICWLSVHTIHNIVCVLHYTH